MVVRWTFYDPVDAETYELELNPNSGGSPTYKKTMTYANTSAPNGKTVVFEGQDEARMLEWSGAILTQTHYDKYVEWWEKRRQIQVTDDLGRQFWVYIVSFTPKRGRSYQHPWKHDFDVSAVILDWP